MKRINICGLPQKNINGSQSSVFSLLVTSSLLIVALGMRLRNGKGTFFDRGTTSAVERRPRIKDKSWVLDIHSVISLHTRVCVDGSSFAY